MPITTTFEDNNQGVLVTCIGALSGQDIITANEELYPNLQLKYQLWNYLKIDRLDISLNQMRQIAFQDNSLPAESQLRCIAVVGVSNELAMLYSQYELMSSAWVGRRTVFKSELFTTELAARQWLHKILS